MSGEATQEELQAGRGYEALFVPALFAPWTGHVTKAARVREGDHVLDIACGSGVLARAALERVGKSGRTAGLDPAPGMIAAAKEVETGIDWVIGSAEDLPFEEDMFDCVISQFGIMFFQDRPKATREMQRVTKPGGRLGLAVWHSVEQNPAYRDIAAVLDEHVSAEAADTVRIPFCLGDPDQVVQLLLQAGFEDIAVETKEETAHFPSTRTMVEVELRGWLPLFNIHLSEEEISDVLKKSDATLSKYATPSGTAKFPTSAYIMSARKPG
ncbi:MAG: class I SAM-dependent methyltransferase [Silicimonas sp.]|nr:class I SAM-dependent methyltransferase [Silicimonas sp.]